LVTEWVNALTRYAFNACSAIRVQIRTQETNLKSICVAERCGYEKEAVLKHDRVDCVTKKPANGILWACTDEKQLPPLEVSWL
jgi:RimJ/RimL family protein N-acetyltransferase